MAPKHSKEDYYEGRRLEIPPVENLGRIQVQSSVANFFSDYIPLSCHMVPSSEPGIWYPIAPPPEGLHPSHFEIYYGTGHVRLRFNEKCIQQVTKTRAPLVAGHSGFLDAFFPVFHSGKFIGVISCGTFLREIPDEPALEKYWKDLTGRIPVKNSPEFLAFVQMALDVPVLDREAQKHLLELMGILSRIYFSNRPVIPLMAEVEGLKAGFFAKNLPFRMWKYVAAKRERLLWWHWHGSRLAPWDKRDFGLQKVPNTVLAVALKSERSGISHIQNMVSISRLHHLCFRISREFPNTVSGRMESGGAVFLTYIDPLASQKKNKADLIRMAHQIASRIERELRIPAAVGVGPVSTVQEEIPDSFREAELALHWGMHSNQTPCFYEDIKANSKSHLKADLWVLTHQMTEATVHLNTAEAAQLQDRFVGQVLRLSNQRLESVRLYFQPVYFSILDVIKKRLLLPERDIRELAEEIQRGLDRCESIPTLLAHFRSTMETLMACFRAPADGLNRFNLDRIKDYMLNHIDSPPRLREIAREMGFSSSMFSKFFGKKAGIPYSDYLRDLRLENARRLLKQSSLPITQIAQACGFCTASYFVQRFRKRYGLTPKAFRTKSN